MGQLSIFLLLVVCALAQDTCVGHNAECDPRDVRPNGQCCLPDAFSCRRVASVEGACNSSAPATSSFRCVSTAFLTADSDALAASPGLHGRLFYDLNHDGDEDEREAARASMLAGIEVVCEVNGVAQAVVRTSPSGTFHCPFANSPAAQVVLRIDYVGAPTSVKYASAQLGGLSVGDTRGVGVSQTTGGGNAVVGISSSACPKFFGSNFPAGSYCGSSYCTNLGTSFNTSWPGTLTATCESLKTIFFSQDSYKPRTLTGVYQCKWNTISYSYWSGDLTCTKGDDQWWQQGLCDLTTAHFASPTHLCVTCQGVASCIDMSLCADNSIYVGDDNKLQCYPPGPWLNNLCNGLTATHFDLAGPLTISCTSSTNEPFTVEFNTAQCITGTLNYNKKLNQFSCKPSSILWQTSLCPLSSLTLVNNTLCATCEGVPSCVNLYLCIPGSVTLIDTSLSCQVAGSYTNDNHCYNEYFLGNQLCATCGVNTCLDTSGCLYNSIAKIGNTMQCRTILPYATYISNCNLKTAVYRADVLTATCAQWECTDNCLPPITTSININTCSGLYGSISTNARGTLECFTPCWGGSSYCGQGQQWSVSGSSLCGYGLIPDLDWRSCGTMNAVNIGGACYLQTCIQWPNCVPGSIGVQQSGFISSQGVLFCTQQTQ